MKKTLLITASLVAAVGAFGQGSVIFNNRVLATPDPGGLGANIYAPIYGPQAGAIGVEQHGQSAAGVPAGGTVYTGPLLAGTGFTAQLWGGPSAGSLLPCTSAGTSDGFATTTFRTSAATAGSVVTLINPIILQNTPAGAGSRGFLELRAWQNNVPGFPAATWAAVMANPAVIPHGASGVFSPQFDLGGGTTLPPNLIGLTSFNLFTVPEPSLIALGALGLGALLLRRRKA